MKTYRCCYTPSTTLEEAYSMPNEAVMVAAEKQTPSYDWQRMETSSGSTTTNFMEK